MTPEWIPLDQMTLEELNSRETFVCWFPLMNSGKGDWVAAEPWCDEWDGDTQLFPVSSWFTGDSFSMGEPTHFLRGIEPLQRGVPEEVEL